MHIKIFFLLACLLPLTLFAQRNDSTKFAGEKNPWIEILGLENDNIETIETAVTERISEGTTSKLFIFTKDKAVRYFRLFTPNKGSSRKRTIKEKEINDATQSYYLNLLQKVRINNFENIEANQLNITNDGDRAVRIADGKTYRLRYIGYDYYKDFSSYAPKRFIQGRVPGWEQRQKLLNLIAQFNKKVKW